VSTIGSAWNPESISSIVSGELLVFAKSTIVLNIGDFFPHSLEVPV
jgi:hypothetical protein